MNTTGLQKTRWAMRPGFESLRSLQSFPLIINHLAGSCRCIQLLHDAFMTTPEVQKQKSLF
jgi:hypothetical protein